MADETAAPNAEQPAKKPQGRGVSYPFIGLEASIEKAKLFHKEERKSAAPVASAMKHFGYSDSSGMGRQTVSALLQFGLLEDEGRKEDRQVKLTDRALTILLDLPDSPARLAALQECVRTPKLYATLLAKYPDELPSDHTIGFFLQKDYDFNPKTLQAFIADFRDSLAYAKLAHSAKIPDGWAGAGGPDSKAKPPLQEVEVGDLIQWEAAGAVQFEVPRRTRAKAEHEGKWWVFVEGSETGIPMSEAVLVEKKPADAGQPPKPPTLPLEGALKVNTTMAGTLASSEREWLRGPLSRAVSYRLVVAGEMGPKEIGKLIKLLQAQQAVLSDDDPPDDAIDLA
jgi:hypothetical protein